MITDIFDSNIVKVLALFSISPGSKFRRKEIKEKTLMNNIPLDKSLIKLTKIGIIKEEKNFYFINPEQSAETESVWRHIKDCYTKGFNEIPLKIFYLLIDISNKLSEIREIKNILLFGSFAKLIYTEKSDIDIAIIFYDKIKERRKTEAKINKIIEKIEARNKEQNKIEIHFFSESDMKNKKDPLIKEVVHNSRQML